MSGRKVLLVEWHEPMARRSIRLLERLGWEVYWVKDVETIRPGGGVSGKNLTDRTRHGHELVFNEFQLVIWQTSHGVFSADHHLALWYMIQAGLTVIGLSDAPPDRRVDARLSLEDLRVPHIVHTNQLEVTVRAVSSLMTV